MLRSDVAKLFPPITPSTGDTLTYGTACQVVEDATTYYCTFPELAPATFPRDLCGAADVCVTVLGPPPSLNVPRLPES